MAAKNSITVKIEYKHHLLSCLNLVGISYKKANIVSKTHITYLINTNHFQQLFLAGFYFCKITGHSPQIF